MSDIWPTLLAAVISAVGMYIGFINRLRSDVSVLKEKVSQFDKQCSDVSKKFEEVNNHYAVIEEKVKRIESRQDSHSKKYDELMSTINELKIEMVKQFSGLKSEINSFNSMVEMSDNGVKINRKKK
jgi:chromosome segregation ATPase